MALDRQSIEKRDFPIVRHGYEPAAVDAHLAEIAAQIEARDESSAAGPLTGGGAAALAADAMVEAAVAEAALAEAAAEQLPEDLEGARLVALNMAMNGTPREETARYLAENFELEDRQRLLDEVYASVTDQS